MIHNQRVTWTAFAILAMFVTQNTLFGNHTAVLGDLFYKAETHSLPKTPCVTPKIYDKSLTKILQDINVPEFNS